MEDGNAICGIMGCRQCLAVAGVSSGVRDPMSEGQKAALSCPSSQTSPSPFELAAKMLSKSFPFLLLFYLFEGLHELATTLFQVLVFHIFLLEYDLL